MYLLAIQVLSDSIEHYAAKMELVGILYTFIKQQRPFFNYQNCCSDKSLF